MSEANRREFLQQALAGLAAIHWGTARGGARTRLRTPSFVSPYDLLTRQALFCWRLLRTDFHGDDPSQWDLLRKIKRTKLGDVLVSILNPLQVAGVMANMTPLGDRALPKYQDLVSDCADILQIKRPHLAMINESMIQPGSPHVYVVTVGNDRVLVVSSRVVDLYQDTHDELRFVLGRQLARVNCETLELRRRLFSLLAVMVRNVAPVFSALPVPGAAAAGKIAEHATELVPLVLDRFLELSLEDERVADRGGFLCCQSRTAAEQALLRESTGISEQTARKYGGDFNADRVLKAIEQWRNAHIGDYLKRVSQIVPATPFIDERIASLRQWDKEQGPQRVLAPRKSDTQQRFQILAISLTNILPPGEAADVYAVGYDWTNKKVCETQAVRSTGSAQLAAHSGAFKCRNGEQLFFEVRARRAINRVTGRVIEAHVEDPLLGVFVVHPEQSQTEYSAKIAWDVHERRSVGRNGIGQIQGKWLA